MTGRELFDRWSGDANGSRSALWAPYAGDWERLAGELTHEMARARNDGVIDVGEALEDAWNRREERRMPASYWCSTCNAVAANVTLVQDSTAYIVCEGTRHLVSDPSTTRGQARCQFTT